jgi:DNA-binding MarR family transcriptional regulator
MKRTQPKAEEPPSPALTDLPCACATARQVARVLTQLYDSRLRSTSLEAPQFALMMTLEKQGACSQVDLGRRYALDKTTVSRNLRLLEHAGWIESSVGRDRRKRVFILTAAGRERLARAKPKWKEAQNQLRSRMTGEQWDTMFRTFRAVTRTAQELQHEAD